MRTMTAPQEQRAPLLYLSWWDQRASVKQNLRALAGRPGAPPLTEGELVLATEVEAGEHPAAVLHAITAGKARHDEIKGPAASCRCSSSRSTTSWGRRTNRPSATTCAPKRRRAGSRRTSSQSAGGGATTTRRDRRGRAGRTVSASRHGRCGEVVDPMRLRYAIGARDGVANVPADVYAVAATGGCAGRTGQAARWSRQRRTPRPPTVHRPTRGGGCGPRGTGQPTRRAGRRTPTARRSPPADRPERRR